jgi:hypothetical protein
MAAMSAKRANKKRRIGTMAIMALLGGKTG